MKKYGKMQDETMSKYQYDRMSKAMVLGSQASEKRMLMAPKEIAFSNGSEEHRKADSQVIFSNQDSVNSIRLSKGVHKNLKALKHNKIFYPINNDSATHQQSHPSQSTIGTIDHVLTQ